MRGEFIRGWDDGRGVDSGRAFGNAQAASRVVNGGYWADTRDNVENVANISQQAFSFTSPYTNSANYGQIRPRNLSLLACIKT